MLEILAARLRRLLPVLVGASLGLVPVGISHAQVVNTANLEPIVNAPLVDDPEGAAPNVNSDTVFDTWNGVMPYTSLLSGLDLDSKTACTGYVDMDGYTGTLEQAGHRVVWGLGAVYSDTGCSLVGWSARVDRSSWSGWRTIIDTDWKPLGKGYDSVDMYVCKKGTYDYREATTIRYPQYDNGWHWAYKTYYANKIRVKCAVDYKDVEDIAAGLGITGG